MRQSIPIPDSNYLMHGGVGSGRYPLGSGERPYQHRGGGLQMLSNYYAKRAEKFENKNKKRAEDPKAQAKAAKLNAKAQKLETKRTRGRDASERRANNQAEAKRLSAKADKIGGNNAKWDYKAKKYRAKEHKVNLKIQNKLLDEVSAKINSNSKIKALDKKIDDAFAAGSLEKAHKMQEERDSLHDKLFEEELNKSDIFKNERIYKRK